jgi:hypothetical protein
MATSLLGQLFNRESEERVNPVGRDLRRRLEGETSLVKTGVWELEDRTAADQIVGHKEVEIQATRPPPFLQRSIPPGRCFELTASIQ